MPRSRFSKLPPGRQRQILERAAEEFAAHGYDHASLNQIITALGLNKGVFYYYFDGKADLFGAVVQMVMDIALPPLAEAIDELEAVTFWPSCHRVLLLGRAQLQDRPWLPGIVRAVLQLQTIGEPGSPVREAVARGREWATALLNRGQQVGAVRTDVTLEYLLQVVTAADQAADRWLLDHWDSLTPDQRTLASRRTVELWRRIAGPWPDASESAR
jgi:AcrR family transcriptional regulator